MRVLVKGANGILCPHVLQRLLARGDEVDVFVRPGEGNTLPYRPLLREVIEGTAGSGAEQRATLGMDVVYDLGTPLNGPGSEDNGRSITAETALFLDASRAAGVERYVFVSSVAVYAPAPYPWMWPISEDSSLKAHGDDRLYRYGETRIEIEELLRAAGRRQGPEYTILRVSAVYGAGAPWVRQILRQIAQWPGATLAMDADGVQMQWTNVGDAANAVARAGVRPEAANEVFNIAGGDLIDQRAVAVALRHITTGFDPSVGWWPRQAPGWRRSWPGENGRHLKYDISKARARLGFIPKVSLEEGLREVVDAFEYGASWGTSG